MEIICGKFGGRQGGEWDGGSRERGWDFRTGASNQILLMKWGKRFKPDGTETTGIRPCVS